MLKELRKFKKFLKIRYFRYLINKTRLKNCGQRVIFTTGVKLLVPKNISIGSNVRIGQNSILSGEEGISIGNNVAMGPEVIIWSANHNYYAPDALPYDAGYIKRPVFICDNVWMGARSCILPGVTIGEGAVIGLRAVVAKDVPPCAVVAGNPAKIIKFRNKDKYYELKKRRAFHII